MATAAQLEALYKKSKSYKVLHNLVNNPKTPNNILEAICRNDEETSHHKHPPHARHNVAVYKNPNIPRTLIESILKATAPLEKNELDLFYEKCNALAENAALSNLQDQLILAKTMRDPTWLFYNQNLHAEVFDYIYFHLGLHSGASGFARSRYFSENYAVVFLNSDNIWMRSAVIKSEYCPGGVVEKARKSGSDEERMAAFSNNIIPVDYAHLDYSDSFSIQGIVTRDDVPEEILFKILEVDELSSNLDLLLKMVRNEITPIAVLENIFDLSEAMDHWAQTWIKGGILRHPNVSASQIVGYLELENKINGVSRSMAAYQLPSWYTQLKVAIDQVAYGELDWEKSSFPRIYIPHVSETIGPLDEVIGVIGGYFYRSDLGDQRIQEGNAPPIAQIDLRELSKQSGVDFGDKILQVWGDKDDWGQGCDAICDTVDSKDVTTRSDKLFFKVEDPEWIVEATQREKAVACFDWTASSYAQVLGLCVPILMTRIDDAGFNLELLKKKQKKQFSEMINHLNWNAEEFEEYKNLQRFSINTAFGNFNEENFMRGSWLPLFSLRGPLDDEIADFFSIFYMKNKQGQFRYKAKAHRWYY